MSFSTTYLSEPATLVPCPPLAAVGAAAPGQPGQELHFDCSAPPCRLTQGVCHQVTQLLRLRHAGVSISLYRVHPLLGRCLRLLRVAHLFTWVV